MSLAAFILVASTYCFISEKAVADQATYYPTAIVRCVAGKQNYDYLIAIESDGLVRYMTLGGAFMTIGPDRLPQRPNQKSVGDAQASP